MKSFWIITSILFLCILQMVGDHEYRGDDVSYTGGTPGFDETTGERRGEWDQESDVYSEDVEEVQDSKLLAVRRPVIPGSPIRGLTPTEFERFRLGREDFLEVETAEEGLGPAYNGTSCGGCHSIPAVGGTSTISEIRAGYKDELGNFTALYGGTLFHLLSTPPHRAQVMIPPEANIIARRVPIPLFGAGLVEAIPDDTIISLEDPEDSNQDGISGRAARIIDIGTTFPRIGRFGWKSQHATLLAFGADAYRNEMGITNALFPHELALGVDPEVLKLADPRPALEDVRERTTGLRGIDNFESFMKFLAPLERGPITSSVIKGDEIFKIIGCENCHVRQLKTGPSHNPLFDRKAVNLFSDLLLHDIGTGDGIPQEAALPTEIRTPSLWGLRFRRPFLHNGSAQSLHDAIASHKNEALSSGQQFLSLTSEQKSDLLSFLNSL